MGSLCSLAYNPKQTNRGVIMPYNTILGIDVSKFDFVVATHLSKKVKTYENSQKGFKSFFLDFKKSFKNCLIVLEDTGGYENKLISYITKLKIDLHKAPGRQIKNFIRSYGKYGKTDKIDAIAIANYGYERQAKLRLYNPKSKISKQLSVLIMRRLDLVKMLTQEKNRIQSPNNGFLKKHIKRLINFIKSEIDQVDREIETLISNNSEYEKKAKILKTIPGIKNKTAPMLLALLPELGKLNGKEIASLCGVAPHPKQSGKQQGYSRTIGGRRYIRPILFLAAMAAARSKTTQGDWYRNLVERGKKPMVALVALMRKLIVIANARIRDLAFAI